VEVRRHERPAGDGGSPLVDAVAWASAPESPGASRCARRHRPRSPGATGSDPRYRGRPTRARTTASPSW
jgi:hypothetical protein